MCGVRLCCPATEALPAPGTSAASLGQAAISYRRQWWWPESAQRGRPGPRGSPGEGKVGFASRCGRLSDSPVSGCVAVLIPVLPREHSVPSPSRHRGRHGLAAGVTPPQPRATTSGFDRKRLAWFRVAEKTSPSQRSCHPAFWMQSGNSQCSNQGRAVAGAAGPGLGASAALTPPPAAPRQGRAPCPPQPM